MHHYVSALTSYNENNKSVKMLLMIAARINEVIIIIIIVFILHLWIQRPLQRERETDYRREKTQLVTCSKIN